MEGREKLTQEFDKTFVQLKSHITESFEHIQNNPQDKDEVIDLWKNYIKVFLQDATKLSERYKNKDIIKAISKMLIFGR